MTIETVALLDHQEAQRLTERIRVALDRVSTAWADLGERITEAYQRRADLALGYSSWAEYAEAELKPSGVLATEVRRQLVGMLAAQGMTSRAIAPAVGVQDSAVRKDLRRVAGGSIGPTSPEPDPAEHTDPSTGEVLTHQTPTTTPSPDRHEPQREAVEPTADRRVVGLDGKTYTRPEPQQQPAQKRRPLPDAFGEGVYQIRLKAESLERLTRDDRFAANKEKTAQSELRRLINTRDLINQVIDQLS